jgi:osmotically inducible protein OsmC
MALSQVLDQGGTPPERLEVAATCTLDLVGSDFRITRVDLDVRGRVPGLDEEGLQVAAERAHEACPVSNALRGNVEVRVNASRQDRQESQTQTATP